MQVAALLGVEVRWLDDPPFARVDIRKPGNARPVWRFRRGEVERFLAEREVKPGFTSPVRG